MKPHHIGVAVTVVLAGILLTTVVSTRPETPRPPTESEREAYRQLMELRHELIAALREATDLESAKRVAVDHRDKFAQLRPREERVREMPMEIKRPLRLEFRDGLNETYGALNAEFARVAAIDGSEPFFRKATAGEPVDQADVEN